MTDKVLLFKEIKDDTEINDIADFNFQAFSDNKDFRWNQQTLKTDMNNGWKIYSAIHDKEIVAALLMKNDGDSLLTKNTPIKMGFQGYGFSHQIKRFYEQQANTFKSKKVINYCPLDNFRMIALNESHGYKRLSLVGENKSIQEWVKNLKP